MSLNIQFSDDTETVIISYFGSPQDPVAFPNQGTVETNDARWHAYYDSMPVWLQSWLPTPT